MPSMGTHRRDGINTSLLYLMCMFLHRSLRLTKSVREGFGDPKFDREGRVMQTDHGTFVLFNVYFPNAGKVVTVRLDAVCVQ